MYLFARAGRTEEALGYLAELEELERTSPELTLHLDFITALAALGRIGAVVLVRHTFAWEDLRPDPRMDEILSAVGL